MTGQDDTYVKEQMIDAQHLLRYYGYLADRYRSRHQFLSFLTIILSTLSAIFLLADLDRSWSIPWIVTLFLFVTTLTSAMFIYDFSGRAQTARLVSEQVREIYIILKQLRLNKGEICKAYELEGRIDAITRVEINVDEKLSKRTYEEARKAVSAATKN